MTCAIVETWLILTVINISITLFSSITRSTGTQEIADEVSTRRVVDARVGITLVDFLKKKASRKKKKCYFQFFMSKANKKIKQTNKTKQETLTKTRSK